MQYLVCLAPNGPHCACRGARSRSQRLRGKHAPLDAERLVTRQQPNQGETVNVNGAPA